MKNVTLEGLYKELEGIDAMLDKAEEEGNEELADEARAKYKNEFQPRLDEEEGLEFLFRQYKDMKVRGNERIDFDDMREGHVEAIVDAMKRHGVREFTFSSGWTNAVEIMMVLQKYGCRMVEMVEVNDNYKKYGRTEFDKIPAVLFVIL